MQERLGRIDSITFGHGGYQDTCFGLSVTLSFDHCGVGDFKGAWDPEMIKCTQHSQWTEADRDQQLAEMCRYVSKLLKDAKVSSVDKLVGKPIMVTTDGFQMKSWRILTEVL